jgi:hypothetical protein
VINIFIAVADFETLYFDDDNEDDRLKYIGKTRNGKAWGKGLMTYKSGELQYGEML